VWDTGGQESFGKVTKNSLTDVEGIVLVFDLTARSSFENLANHVKDISTACKEDVVFVVAGNKSDQKTEQAVGKDDADEKAKDWENYGCKGYFEISALDGSGVDEMFKFLLQKMIANHN